MRTDAGHWHPLPDDREAGTRSFIRRALGRDWPWRDSRRAGVVARIAEELKSLREKSARLSSGAKARLLGSLAPGLKPRPPKEKASPGADRFTGRSLQKLKRRDCTRLFFSLSELRQVEEQNFGVVHSSQFERFLGGDRSAVARFQLLAVQLDAAARDLHVSVTIGLQLVLDRFARRREPWRRVRCPGGSSPSHRGRPEKRPGEVCRACRRRRNASGRKPACGPC